MTVSFDASLLVSYYQAKQGLTPAATTAAGKAATKVPTAPWNTGAKAPTLSQAAAQVLAGAKFVDPSSVKVDVAGAPADYKDLFALNQGLSALEGLATQAQDPATTPQRRAELSAKFNAGLKEVSAFLAGQPFKGLSVAAGSSQAIVTSGATVKRETATYTTGTLATGSPDAEVDALTGPLAFSADFAGANGRHTVVSFDLSNVQGPRTLANVTTYLNGQLAAAGLSSRFAIQRTPAKPDTVQAGGKTITLSPGRDSYALKLNGSTTEVPTFTAADTSPAVYVSHATGAGDAAAQELVKLDPSQAGGADPLFGRKLPAGVTSVKATATGADGSLYVLAQASDSVAGQAVKGAQDVVLLRYDSAGTLSYARTLGAATSASGFALAVSTDGKKVAVAGSVTGALGDDGGIDPATADSFVSVYGADGVEQWTQRRGATGADEADAVVFGADGSVYVAGRTSSALPGATAQGGQDAYLEGFSARGASTGVAQFGTPGSDKATGVTVTADGKVVTASVEDGRGVLRQFDPQLGLRAGATATRDLGNLGGGELLGVAVDANGSLRVAGTARGGLSLGSETQPYPGGKAVFAASFSPDLTPAPSDKAAWWSAGADATASAFAVAAGEVYVTGTVKGAPADGGTTASTQGFAVALNPLDGSVGWSRSFTAGGGQDAPSALTVDPAGASSLDRLGLPSGALDYSDATDLVSATALRPGDSFKIAVGGAAARTVSLEAGDTLADLAAKINRATGFASAAKVVSIGGYDRLSLAPANSGASLTLSAGPAGSDALKALGLTEGLIATPAKAVGKAAAPKSYALNLAGAPSLATVASSKAALAKVSTAATIVRQAYFDLSNAATAPTKPGKTGGTVPAYLTAQIANYQQALARLGG